MKHAITAVLVLIIHTGLIQAAKALIINRKYDFYCKDGQNIKNASLLEEAPEGFRVTIAFVQTPIFIARDNLEREPVLSRSGNPHQLGDKQEKPTEIRKESTLVAKPARKKIWLGLGAGYVFNAIGPLNEIFPQTVALSGQAEYFFDKRYFWLIDGISAGSHGLEFRNDVRYLRLWTAEIGFTTILWKSKQQTFLLKTDVFFGTIFRDMQGYEFTEKNSGYVTRLNATFRVDWKSLSLDITVTGTYMEDRSIFFAPVGTFLRIGFGF